MKRTLVIMSLTVLVLLSIQGLIFMFSTDREDIRTVKEVRKSGYKMINPILDFYELKPVLVKEVKTLQSELTGYIEKVKKDNKAEIVSVYYRDLNNGPWIGIKEDEPYFPASLLKVPFMIAVLKKAEDDASFLSQKIRFDVSSGNAVQYIEDGAPPLVPGKEYTVEELLRNMIVYSSNQAKSLLVSNLDIALLHDVFYDLNIPIERYTGVENFLSAKEYAAYFRILYNATYLNKGMSEKALTLLSQTTFNQGIVAGVPQGVVIAHKFGILNLADKNSKQLHNCGIVYKGNNPYLICIMTRGTDPVVMAGVIADISAIVYNSPATGISNIRH